MKIVYSNSDGVLVITPSPEFLSKIKGTELEKMEAVALKNVLKNVNYKIVEDSVIPETRIFRTAWELSEGIIVENLDKSKLIAHEKRREHRDMIMAPLDRKATIPLYAEQAEIDRQIERELNAVMQESMDSASTISELKSLIPTDI